MGTPPSDRTRPLKHEDLSTGGQASQRRPFPVALNPNEDALDARGIFFQDASSNDELVVIFREAGEMHFLDPAVGTSKTLAQLAATDDATAIRTKLLTVDGVGSGIDADKLDGQEGSFYAPINAPTFTGGAAAVQSANGTVTLYLNTNNGTNFAALTYDTSKVSINRDFEVAGNFNVTGTGVVRMPGGIDLGLNANQALRSQIWDQSGVLYFDDPQGTPIALNTIRGKPDLVASGGNNGTAVTAARSNHTHPAAVASGASGLMTGADKAKLDGIAAGANNYSLPTASASVKGGIRVGSGLTMVGDVLSATGGGGGTQAMRTVIGRYVWDGSDYNLEWNYGDVHSLLPATATYIGQGEIKLAWKTTHVMGEEYTFHVMTLGTAVNMGSAFTTCKEIAHNDTGVTLLFWTFDPSVPDMVTDDIEFFYFVMHYEYI